MKMFFLFFMEFPGISPEIARDSARNSSGFSVEFRKISMWIYQLDVVYKRENKTSFFIY